MREPKYGEDHRCEAPGCSNASPGARTCRPACRSKLWKVETGYKDRRSVRNARRPHLARPQTRYAIVERRGLVLEVVGFEAARSKRAVERAFGIVDRPDISAIAERSLPAARQRGGASKQF